MAILHITDEGSFAELIASPKPVLVDFYASWCGPCKMLSKTLELVDAEQDVVIGKVDVDELPQIAAEYGVMSVPTLMAFQEGSVNEVSVGAVPKAKVLDLLRK